jgi:glycosyltransferase involved in cell wall biosynthesis
LGYETHLSVPSRNKPAIIAYCGRIDNQQKNISFLIKLMKYLHKLTPYQLVLWGGGEMVKDLSNKPNIVYRGTYSSDTDLRNIYQDVKFAINTSRTEGFSYSLLEAMSLGVPIIVRDTYSNARFLVNGKKNGIIIPKKMKPQIAAAHIASLINKIDYERMQKNCLSFVKNKCNIKLVNQKLLTAFSSVLDHK